MTAQETNVVNAVATTLASTMAAGATSFTVASASGFPSVPFYVVIDPDTPGSREYMLVDSAVAGTTCSMTATSKRNLSGSAGDVEHASGAVVRVTPPMKQLFDDIHDRVDLILKVSGVAAGDMMYVTSVASGQATFARLATGTDGHVLTLASGLPSWAGGASPALSSAVVAAAETTTSTSFTDLATSGPAVTLTTGTRVLVIVSGQGYVSLGAGGGSTWMGVAVSGATTTAAADTDALKQASSVNFYPDMLVSCAFVLTVTAGSNTFTAKYRTAADTATWANRKIMVLPIT